MTRGSEVVPARREELEPPDPDPRPVSGLRVVMNRVTQVCAVIAACIYGGLMLLTVADVVRRGLTDRSVEGLFEASPLLLLSATCLGLAYAEAMGVHVRTSLVTDRLPPQVTLVIRALGMFIGALLMAWIGWEAVDKAREAYEAHETTLGLRPVITWPAKALVPVGFVLLAIQLVFRVGNDIDSLRRHRRPHSIAGVAGVDV
jgi:TRAP-type mannitol/chloroaromatic compound transport system permease small subunit